jgi:hypothetical protein
MYLFLHFQTYLNSSLKELKQVKLSRLVYQVGISKVLIFKITYIFKTTLYAKLSKKMSAPLNEA